MKRVTFEDEESLPKGLSKNPAEKIWFCPECGEMPPIVLAKGWYARRPCPCERRAEEERQRRLLPRTLADALRLAQQGQTYTWLGREWAEQGVQEKVFATFARGRHPRAFDQAQQFATAPRGVLAFYGSYGLGKTHLLAAIANARSAADHLCLFASATTLFEVIGERISRDQGYHELVKRAITTPLLLLDDLDKPKPSEFRQEMYYQIIDGRIKAGRPLAITTNCSPIELARWIGGAAQSRLMVGLTPVLLTGSDYRLTMH